jgi:hypothetical protein
MTMTEHGGEIDDCYDCQARLHDFKLWLEEQAVKYEHTYLVIKIDPGWETLRVPRAIP